MRVPRARTYRWLGLLSAGAVACRPASDSANRPAQGPVVSMLDPSASAPASSATASTTSLSAVNVPGADAAALRLSSRDPARGNATSPAGDLALGKSERFAPQGTLPVTWPEIPAPAQRSPWCVQGLATLDARSCYQLPPKPTRTLLIYLHGIVPPRNDSPEKTKVQTVIMEASQSAGIAVIVPRGRDGFGPRGRETWVGWPTTQVLYDKYANEIVSELAGEREKLEKLTGVTFSPVYLAGSSSGAYFVTRLALRGGMDVDGFGAMSGGTSSDVTDLTGVPVRPFYIGYGKFDPYVSRAIPTLADLLRRAHWPLRVAEHPVDHGARHVYFEEALAFWRENSQ